MVVQQRLHGEDLSGRLFDGNEPWSSCVIPAIAGEDITYKTPFGGTVTSWKGMAICPERQTRQELKGRLDVKGAVSFAAQYLQEPYPGDDPQESYWAWAWVRPPKDWDPQFGSADQIKLQVPQKDRLLVEFFGYPEPPYTFNDPNEMATETWERLSVGHQEQLAAAAHSIALERNAEDELMDLVRMNHVSLPENHGLIVQIVLPGVGRGD